MTDESTQKDIRRLLKTFGVQAESAIVQHLQHHPQIKTLQLRIRLEDLTSYPDDTEMPLAFSVEGEVRQGED